MKEIRSIHAAHEISDLIMNAEKSIVLYAPDGWQFFSFGKEKRGQSLLWTLRRAAT